MPRRQPKNFLPVSDRVSIFRRGKIWQVSYQLDGKQVRASLKTSSKKEADRKAGEIDRKLTRGENPQAADRTIISDRSVPQRRTASRVCERHDGHVRTVVSSDQ